MNATAVARPAARGGMCSGLRATLLATLSAVGCTPAGGRSTPVVHAVALPSRIVSLNCSATDVLAALGAMDRVLAVEEDCPICGAEDKVLIRNDDHLGKTKPLSLEAVLALHPDAVLVRPSLAPLFAPSGLLVLPTPARADLTTLPEFVRTVAVLVGAEARAEAVLADMAAGQERIRRRCADLPRVSVYYETTGLGLTVGTRSAMHAMIELAGGTNLAGAIDRPSAQLGNEAIVAADPDVIVLSPFADPTPQVVQRPGWSGLRAVRTGRVHRLPLDRRYVALATPRCVQGCEELLVPWFHPELAATPPGR